MRKRRKIILDGFKNKSWVNFDSTIVTQILNYEKNLDDDLKVNFLKSLETFLFQNIHKYPRYTDYYSEKLQVEAANNINSFMLNPSGSNVVHENGGTDNYVQNYINSGMQNIVYPTFLGIEAIEIDSFVDAYLKIYRKNFIKDAIKFGFIPKEKGFINTRIFTFDIDNQNKIENKILNKYLKNKITLLVKEKKDEMEITIIPIFNMQYAQEISSLNYFVGETGDGGTGNAEFIDILEYKPISFQDKNGDITDEIIMYASNFNKGDIVFNIPSEYLIWQSRQLTPMPTSSFNRGLSWLENLNNYYRFAESTDFDQFRNNNWFFYENFVFDGDVKMHILDFFKSMNGLYSDMAVITSDASVQYEYKNDADVEIQEKVTKEDLINYNIIDPSTNKIGNVVMMNFSSLNNLLEVKSKINSTYKKPKITTYYPAQTYDPTPTYTITFSGFWDYRFWA